MRLRSVVALAVLVVVGNGSAAKACPFCRAVSETFSDRMKAAAVVVRARLLQVQNPDAPANLVRTWPYQVLEVLKGEPHVHSGLRILAPRLDRYQLGTQVVILGADPPDIYWAVPVVISDRAWQYICRLPSLPEGPQRLQFFLPRLTDPDPFVAQDAYDEFAKAPYQWVQALAPQLNPQQLRRQITDPKTTPALKRLLLLLLAQCGGEAEAGWLEELLARPHWSTQEVRWLDAAIACYLSLRGPQGLEFVKRRFLGPQVPFAETFAAVLAIRFHGQQEKIISREKLIQTLHALLDRPRMVDLVLPDLARWEDWSLVERLSRMFEQLGPEEQFVRPAIVRYMLACPRPEAKQVLARWEKQYPRLVRQARLLPLGRSGVSRRPGRDPSKSSGNPAFPSASARQNSPKQTPPAPSAQQPPQLPKDQGQLPLVAPEPQRLGNSDASTPAAHSSQETQDSSAEDSSQQQSPVASLKDAFAEPWPSAEQTWAASVAVVLSGLALVAFFLWLLR